MIIREQPGDGPVLVEQTDHSRLVGQLAAHWGNDRFALPRPYGSVVRGATYHDYGWLRYETSPGFDIVSGDVFHFMKPPETAMMLEGYQWSFDWLLGDDLFASLLANRHRTGLWRDRYGTITHPPHPHFPNMPEPIVEYVARNETWQADQMAKVDAREFDVAYRLMQLWDILGLYFCCADPIEQYVEPVPTDYDHDPAEGVRINLLPLGPRRVRFDPYPFDQALLRLHLPVRKLRRARWTSTEEFQRDYYTAPVENLEFEVVG